MIKIPQRLLGEALLFSAGQYPAKTAIIIKEKEYQYSSLRESSEKLAVHLVLAGIKKGDRVAIYMNNSWQSVISIYGVTLSGAAFLVINPQTRADKLQYILNDSGARILISESILGNELSQALTGSKEIQEVIITGSKTRISGISGIKLTDFENIISGNKPDCEMPKVIPNDLAALIYTSGSTGFPKGVMMTHQSMVFTSWSLIEYLRLSEEDRIILLLPLAFDYGLYQLLMAITIGGSLIVEQSFTFQTSVYKQIELFKPTVFPGVPTIYAMMIATNKKTGLSFDCIKKVTNTAAALPAEFIPDLKKIFPEALIFKMYGLTECKRVCYLEPELVDIKSDSVGKAIPGTEVFLLSPDGNPVPAGERGILHIRGPHVMLGYWHKEELSREMLRQGDLPGERILCSNDWFRMDDEGFLYFLGRTDDIIKTRGEKVSPAEIENVIYKIAGIKEVAVIGIPDEIMGEAIIAFVTTHGQVELGEKDIQKECMTRLELFMVPHRVIFLNEMPKSSNSKIDKKELKKSYLQNE
jgi:acyl-CoA synthetase (AMP-forming)/AMP-acid ligase II